MSAVNLGVLRPVDLRTVWSHEANGFTPWLADNLARLGEALGLELEVTQREARIGDFAVDLLCRDLNSERPVVIENQLATTNHDHLGKLLTYAAGVDAGAVIWVVPEMRDEHRQALDWLNQHTVPGLAFYGVVVEAVQIDESRPAVTFRPVSFPKDFGKIQRAEADVAAPGRVEYLAYWQSLVDRLRYPDAWPNGRAPSRGQNWMHFRSGTSGIVYAPSFANRRRVRTEVAFIDGDADVNKARFDSLARRRAEFETSFGEPLSWERLEGKTMCRIACYRPGSIDADPASLDEIRAWHAERLLRFKRVFGPHLAGLDELEGEEEKTGS
jgi:hypothetical protein